MSDNVLLEPGNTRAPNLTEKLAATLILAGLVDREAAKSMTAREIVGLFDCDHFPIPRAMGGSNHPTNLNMRLRPGHRAKTAAADIPMIAKVKRGAQKRVEHEARMSAKLTGELVVEKPRRSIPSRKFQSGARPMRGGKSDRYMRKLNGRTVERHT